MDEAGLQIKSLTLLNVFSGERYYFKNKNRNKIYSVTAVFMSNDYEGKLKCDGYETKKLEFVDLSNFPEDLTDEYKGYILPFSSLIMNRNFPGSAVFLSRLLTYYSTVFYA